MIKDLPNGRTPIRLGGVKGIINNELYKVILKNPSLLLFNEYNELIRRHRPKISPSLFPKPRPQDIQKNLNESITVSWSFKTGADILVELFHDYYGMHPNSWKSFCFKRDISFIGNIKVLELMNPFLMR